MTDSLPNGWATAALGDVCVTKVAQSPPTDDPVPYIDISAIDRTTKRISETKLVSANDAPTRARQWVRARDVLVSMTRPNLNAVARVSKDLDGAVASTGFDVLRPVGVIPDWVFYRVRTNEFIADVCEDLQGVVYPAIRPHDVRRHILPIPPEREQRRIVEAIESYFTRLDDAVATLERVQRNLKRYRASVLKAAIEGRLVPTEAELARAEGRDYKPASVLLERILAERRRRWEEAELAKMKAKGRPPKDDKWKAKYKEPVAPDATGLPELPEAWCWASLDALLREPLRNGHSARASKDGTGIRTLTLTAVTYGDFSEGNTKITTADPSRVKDLWLEPGDILVERSNTPDLVGTARLYRGPRGFSIFPDLLIRARLSPPVTATYIEAVLRSLDVRSYFRRAAQGIAGTMPKISQGTIAGVAVPLPPALEQTRIAEELQRQTSLVADTERVTLAARVRCTRLRQSILKWAFEGRLVDQDPTDEPASKLLERIQAERKATPPRPSRSRRAAHATRNR